MFTDTEVGMSLAHNRNMRDVTGHAQAIIDRKTAEISMLMSALQSARDELRIERAKRLQAEMRLEAILDLEV